MAYDFKKEYKEFYKPGKKVTRVKIPEFKFVAVRGSGDPNEEEGEYKKAVELLYSLSYTIKMSKKGTKKIEGYFNYVVPPLEGLWWNENRDDIDLNKKDEFNWIAMIRLPDFVTVDVFNWAAEEVKRKKQLDVEKLEFLEYAEGDAVQCLHVGSYDNEDETIAKIDAFISKNDLIRDPNRNHHEIYLSDPRRTKEENLKTIIRIPVKRG